MEVTHEYDRQEELPIAQPIIAQSLVTAARTWATLHPGASLRDRMLLAARVQLELCGGMACD